MLLMPNCIGLYPILWITSMAWTGEVDMHGWLLVFHKITLPVLVSHKVIFLGVVSWSFMNEEGLYPLPLYWFQTFA